MTIELSAVVEDELPALVEDALHLPPIDLVGGDEDFDHSRIHVLVPMPAARLASLRLARVAVPKQLLLSPALSRQKPLATLRDLIIKRRPGLLVDPTDLVDNTRPEPAPILAAWRQALAAQRDRMLWFVRVPAVAQASVELFDEFDPDHDGIPRERVIVTRETATDRNVEFLDIVTRRIMSREQFVTAIRAGSYPDYEVRLINGLATPMSRANQTTDDNLG
jgi:hypothetical protein